MLELPVAAACRDKNPAVFRKQRQRHADLTNGMAAFRDWGSSPGARGSGKVPAPHLFRCDRGHGLHGQDTDRAKLRKGNARVKECLRHPFDSIVKPGPLKGGVSGFRSRRTCHEHRPVSGARRDAGKREIPGSRRRRCTGRKTRAWPASSAVCRIGRGAPAPSAVVVFCLAGRAW
ncbi:MAG: type II toxin-antitoxin system YoeB family toxin [Cereibacter sp.]